MDRSKASYPSQRTRLLRAAARAVVVLGVAYFALWACVAIPFEREQHPAMMAPTPYRSEVPGLPDAGVIGGAVMMDVQGARTCFIGSDCLAPTLQSWYRATPDDAGRVSGWGELGLSPSGAWYGGLGGRFLGRAGPVSGGLGARAGWRYVEVGLPIGVSPVPGVRLGVEPALGTSRHRYLRLPVGLSMGSQHWRVEAEVGVLRYSAIDTTQVIGGLGLSGSY